MTWPKEKRGRPHLLLAEIEKSKGTPTASMFRDFPSIEYCRYYVRLKGIKVISELTAIECLIAYRKHREECSK